jgi:sugar O-acyltransferase (sialic acid O-acetyltransferase NeuD family)
MRAFIYGAGAQGRVVLDILRLSGGYESVEFIDDSPERWGSQVNGAPVVRGLDYVLEQPPSAFRIIIAIGHPTVRMSLLRRLQERSVPLLNAVHPTAVIMPSVSMGGGNTICAGAIVNTDARLGDGTIINTAAVLEHDSVLGDGVLIGPGVQLGGRTRVGAGAFVCTGAIVLPRVSIGAGSIVAAGAVVTKPVPDNVLVMGLPARVCRTIDANYDWHRLL